MLLYSTSSGACSLTFPQAFTLDFSDDGQARASQHPDGSGAVYVNTLWANGSAQNTIRANGSPIFLASASIFGGSVSHQLIESGVSLGPSFAKGCSTFGYDFQSYSDIIDLGLVGPGETITVEYEMVATVDTLGFEAGGRAQIGDPFDLESTPGFVGTLRADGVVSNDENTWGRVKSLYR